MSGVGGAGALAGEFGQLGCPGQAVVSFAAGEVAGPLGERERVASAHADRGSRLGHEPVWFGGLGVGQEQPVEVELDRLSADLGLPGCQPPPCVPAEQDSGEQAPELRVGVGCGSGADQLVNLRTQGGGNVVSWFQAVQGEGQGRAGAGFQACRDDGIGLGFRRVQERCLPPPVIADRARELVGEPLFPDVRRGQVFLEGLVGEGVLAGLAFGQQSVGDDVREKSLRSRCRLPRRNSSAQRGPMRPAGTARRGQDVGSAQVGNTALHHRVSEVRGERRLSCRRPPPGEVLGVLPSPQHHLAYLGVQVGAAAGKRAAVAVHVGDHRQQQGIDREVVERRSVLQAPQKVVGACFCRCAVTSGGCAGAVPLRRQVPAGDEIG